MPDGLTSLDIYIAVASPSMFGLVAKMMSLIFSSFIRLIKSVTLISTGIIPSNGVIDPCNMLYVQLYSFLFSIAITSFESSHTHTTVSSLDLSEQTEHMSCLVICPQIVQ